MPGKGNLPNYAEDRREVDILVQEIKENLNLEKSPVTSASSPSSSSSSGLKSVSSHRRSVRHCPYAVPPGTLNETSPLQKWRAANRPQRRRYPSTSASEFLVDDPFRMLQELISDGSLIKEAVRRLQLGLSPKLSGNYYNDSDEDCRSSPGKKPYSFCQVTTGGI
ncbi:uncharacterized protein [Lepeophtheirus salmonis]|uniref:Uncharacterized protein n=1 Tax=Lepeophtheirus salmonis TaxID=72036 RepID=A0A0K2UF02_LEPSM|nr:GSK-3-binding protein FRAT2-like [Lepeophtheirus salmonis]